MMINIMIIIIILIILVTITISFYKTIVYFIILTHFIVNFIMNVL